MNKYILNFYDLHSPKDEIVYRAVLEKKDWMFRKLFFECDFRELEVDGVVTYPDLFGLMDQSFVFHKLNLNPSNFEKHEKDIKRINTAFNAKYRIRYCSEKIVKRNNNSSFYVEMDFSKLDKKAYNDLVCNFFPCVSNIKDLDLFFDENNEVDLLKYPMIGEDGNWVFILDANLLVNDRCYMQNCLKKIHYDSSMLDEEKIKTLKEIADANLIEAEDYYDK